MRAVPVAVLAALLLAGRADAAVVYERGLSTTSIYVAGDDGGAPHRLVTGTQPHISPDGAAVVYVAHGDGASPELREIPAAGGASQLLLKPVRYGSFAWSPDGRYVAVESGPLNGAQRLVLIDRASGTSRTAARGRFYGASFSPDGTRLVYSRSSRSALFPVANLEVAPVAGGTPQPLTKDGRAMYPLWGPQRIAYVRYRRPARRVDSPKFNLWLLHPDGTARTQLTHDKVPFLLTGLTPTAWSADGTRLLAQFGGQDTTYAVTVDPATGAERVIGSKSQGFRATGLSRDGSTIIGSSGGFEFGGHAQIVTAPYGGGRTDVLIARGRSPDWNR